MRYIWEDIDLVMGRRIWNDNRASNGEKILGYMYPPSLNPREMTMTVTCLSDGLMFFKTTNREEMIEFLNKNGYRPAEILLPDIQRSEN